MSKPTLTPDSKTSSVVLPMTGTSTNVDSNANPLPFGVYTRHHFEEQSREDFASGAVDQVAYVYKKLGGDVLDVEITEYQVYAAYEEAVLEYSYILNLHQTKNALGSSLGDMTGSFDEDGELRAAQGTDGADLSSSLAGQRVELAYPKFDISFEKRVGDRAATEANLGGSQPIYSASIDTVAEQADYDVQALIYSASTSNSALPYYNVLSNSGNGKKKINIKKVYYKTPHAMWRFYGAYGGLNAVGNLSSYGQFADESTFEIVPTWQNKAQAKQYEDHIYTRISHYSYELKNNKLRLFPAPQDYSPDAFWLEFTVDEEAWTEQDDRKVGVRGINNMNTMPFANIPFNNINAIGKQWIRRFALALSKEMLGLIRSKFGSIPIPGESITLNGSDLVSQSKEEQDKLREELKTTLDELTYQKLAESNAAIIDSSGKTLQGVPLPIHVG
jgi:hypothetical protein